MARVILLIFMLCLAPLSKASAQAAMQTVTASQNGVALPARTGQMIDPAVLNGVTCQQIVTQNLALAPGYGYTVSGGSFTDPVTGITITQGCDNPQYYAADPAPPWAGARPAVAPVSVTMGVASAVIVIIGQSNAAPYGAGRYTSTYSLSFDYAGGGVFYPASDPRPDPGDPAAIDAGPFVRLGDLMVGETGLNGYPINRIVLADRAVGGTSICEWAPASAGVPCPPGIGSPGDENAYMVAEITDVIQNVVAASVNGTPSLYIVWEQGEADASGSMTQAQYQTAFIAMLQSIRSIPNAGGIAATTPIYISKTTTCNERSSANYPPPASVYARTPDFYIAQAAGTLAIRAAQAAIPNGAGMRAGPDTDSIAPNLRFDGCHLSYDGLVQEAQIWLATLH